jgi:hypothetical protein
MARIRIFALGLAAALILGGGAPAFADASFLAEIDDLPLAPGLVEQPGGTLFDTPEGRIVEATAEGDTTATNVTAFYVSALPELGWRQIDANTFERDKEILHIVINKGEQALSVRFSLAPDRIAP